MKKFILFGLITVFAKINSQVITTDEQRDLQLFSTFAQQPGLIKFIDYTSTKLGNKCLQNQLANPLSDINELNKRQETIKYLLDSSNESTYKSIVEQLKLFANNEKSLELVGTDCQIGNAIIENFYFKNSYLKWLNKYPAGLELGQVTNLVNLFAPIIEHAAMHFLISDKLHNYLGMCCSHSHHDHGHKVQKGDKKHKSGKHDHKHDHSAPSTAARLAYNAYNIAHTAVHIIGVKGLIDHVRQQINVIKEIQAELIKIRKCVESARHVYELLKSNSPLNQNFKNYERIRTLFEADNLSENLAEFIGLINLDTFRGEATCFARYGNILRAYDLKKIVTAELIEKLDLIGELDFYVSCAQLYNQFKDSSVPLTFANFNTEKAPYVSIQGFWNPLLEDKQIINEKICFGNDNPKIALVTGPNKSGKSTCLGAITLAIILSQTIGMAPAQFIEFTPFSYIRSGFNMVSRVKQGQSLFTCSLDFANEILNYTKANKEVLAFVVVDELFNSTDFSQGILIARNFVKQLGTRSNCIAIMATHFNSLTELESEDPKIYKNLKTEYIDGVDKAAYSIKRGISSHKDVLQLVEQDDLLMQSVC